MTGKRHANPTINLRMANPLPRCLTTGRRPVLAVESSLPLEELRRAGADRTGGVVPERLHTRLAEVVGRQAAGGDGIEQGGCAALVAEEGIEQERSVLRGVMREAGEEGLAHGRRSHVAQGADRALLQLRVDSLEEVAEEVGAAAIPGFHAEHPQRIVARPRRDRLVVGLPGRERDRASPARFQLGVALQQSFDALRRPSAGQGEPVDDAAAHDDRPPVIQRRVGRRKRDIEDAEDLRPLVAAGRGDRDTPDPGDAPGLLRRPGARPAVISARSLAASSGCSRTIASRPSRLTVSSSSRAASSRASSARAEPPAANPQSAIARPRLMAGRLVAFGTRPRGSRSGEDRSHDPPAHVTARRWPWRAYVSLVCWIPGTVQDRGVEVVDMNGVLGEVIRVIVDGSERLTEMRLRESACPHKNLMERRADQAGSWQWTAGLLPP